MSSILRLDISGQPRGWIGRETAASAYATGSVVWGLGDASITIHGGIQRATGRQSVIHMQPVIALRGRVKGSFVPTLTNAALFRRDQYRCLYCGYRFPRGQLTRDHIQPRSRGGIDHWRNCATACRGCNHRKSNMTLEEAGYELMAVPFEPNIWEWHFLAKERVQGDAFEYLADKFTGLRQWAA